MSAAGPSPVDDEKAVMLREIALQPHFVRGAIATMVSDAREALTRHGGREVSAGYVIGCGDSYCAALAARGYMTAMTRRWVEPVEAFEFAGYLAADVPAGSFVVGISNSGTVAATVDGVRRARAAGAWTFAVTVDEQSVLAACAETLVRIEAPPNIKSRADGGKLVTPGTLTYTASLLGACATAIALGEHTGARSGAAVDAAVGAFAQVADWMAEADAALAASAAQIAGLLAPDRTIVIAGGGPNAATAHLCAAKFYEAVQWPVHHVQIEEWAHEQYFFTGPRTDTFVLLPPGAAHARGLEQLRAARDMGSRTFVIGERGDDAAAAAADVFIALPPGIPETLTPFVYKLPLEYVSAHLAALRGSRFFGFDDPVRQAVNFRQIFVPPATAT